jgi:putative heme transporter
MRRLSRRTIFVIASVTALVYAVALVLTLTNLDIPPFDFLSGILLIVAAAGQLAALWAFGLQFRHGVVETGGHLQARSAVKAALVGAGVARLIPAGGAVTPVAMSWMVRKEARASGGAAVRATVLNYAGLLLGTGFALLWVINRGLYESLEAGTWVLGIIAISIGLVLLFGTRLIGLLATRLPPRFRDRLGPPMVSHIPDGRSQFLLWARLALEAFALFLVMQAFGLHLTPMQTAAAFGVGQLAGGLPGTPGGVGFAEAGLVGALAAFGFEAEISLAPILIYRIVSYWIPLIAGLVAGGTSFLNETTQPELAGRPGPGGPAKT